MNWITKIMGLLAGLLFFAIPVYIGVVILAVLNQFHWAYILGGMVAIALLAIILKTFNQLHKQKVKKGFLIVAVLIFIGTAIPTGLTVYDRSIPKVNAEINVYEYQPFTNAKLAKLPEKASIQLSEPLPVIDGATALYPYYAALAEAIYPEKNYDPYESEIMVNQTHDAYTNLMNGSVDLIFAAGPSKQQQARAEQAGLALELIPIGREAFVFFVQTNNPVTNLTIEQVQQIYAGTIMNWSEVGGANKDIRAFQRPEDSGSQTALQRLMGDIPIMEAPIDDVVTGMGGIIREVATYKNYPNAIGYTFRYFSNEMVKDKNIKLLALNGVAPTKETIRNNSYPIASEFYIVTTKERSEQTNQLIDWVLSEEGQQLMEIAGYVSLTD